MDSRTHKGICVFLAALLALSCYPWPRIAWAEEGSADGAVRLDEDRRGQEEGAQGEEVAQREADPSRGGGSPAGGSVDGSSENDDSHSEWVDFDTWSDELGNDELHNGYDGWSVYGQGLSPDGDSLGSYSGGVDNVVSGGQTTLFESYGISPRALPAVPAALSLFAEWVGIGSAAATAGGWIASLFDAITSGEATDEQKILYALLGVGGQMDTLLHLNGSGMVWAYNQNSGASVIGDAYDDSNALIWVYMLDNLVKIKTGIGSFDSLLDSQSGVLNRLAFIGNHTSLSADMLVNIAEDVEDSNSVLRSLSNSITRPILDIQEVLEQDNALLSKGFDDIYLRLGVIADASYLLEHTFIPTTRNQLSSIVSALGSLKEYGQADSAFASKAVADIIEAISDVGSVADSSEIADRLDTLIGYGQADSSFASKAVADIIEAISDVGSVGDPSEIADRLDTLIGYGQADSSFASKAVADLLESVDGFRSQFSGFAAQLLELLGSGYDDPTESPELVDSLEVELRLSNVMVNAQVGWLPAIDGVKNEAYTIYEAGTSVPVDARMVRRAETETMEYNGVVYESDYSLEIDADALADWVADAGSCYFTASNFILSSIVDGGDSQFMLRKVAVTTDPPLPRNSVPFYVAAGYDYGEAPDGVVAYTGQIAVVSDGEKAYMVGIVASFEVSDLVKKEEEPPLAVDLSGVESRLDAIVTLLTLAGAKDVLDDIVGTFDGAATSAASAAVSSAIQSAFPFCVPAVVKQVLGLFEAEARPPSFHFEIWGAPLDFDFSDWEGLAEITRWLCRIGFSVMLLSVSRRFVFMGGMGSD